MESERLALTASGQMRYTLKTPYRDGTTRNTDKHCSQSVQNGHCIQQVTENQFPMEHRRARKTGKRRAVALAPSRDFVQITKDRQGGGPAAGALRTQAFALTARLDNTYTGSRTDETYSINQLPSYDLTNIRAGLDAGHWNAVLFVNNVADKRALISNITQAAENIPTFNRVAVSQPRTTGIDLNYRFGGH